MPIDGRKLRGIVESYERLEGGRRDAQEDQKQLLTDAEEDGFDKKLVKRLIRELRRDKAELAAEEDAMQEYRDAYLKFEATPLGAAAEKRAQAHAAE